jgi:hypothetical protein
VSFVQSLLILIADHSEAIQERVVNVSLSLFIPINHLTILSAVAIAGGLYFFFLGFQLLARKRLLLATPSSKVRSAALGLVEVNGVAAGPYTMPAPITGKPCFLYHTTAWQQRADKKEWEKVADETLHLPFFIDDGTGQLLIEPLGADLDLHHDFREEYAASFFSSNFFSNEAVVSPRISVFLSRHGIVPARRLRIEERLIEPEDALFIAGTLTENPGVAVQPFSPREVRIDERMDVHRDDSRADQPSSSSDNPSGQLPAQQVIRLQSGVDPPTTPEMSQQAKIAAALARAGITKPEAWSAAGVPYQSVAVQENAPPEPVSDPDEGSRHEDRRREDQPQLSGYNLTPPVVLMIGANDPTFVISFRSQKEFVTALAWKSAAMVWGGAAITLLGVYMLLAQMELL